MSGLAANARKRGDAAAAVDWSQRAWEAASGPATRLQWGAAYVRALVELAPADAPRLQRALLAIVGELEPAPATFDGRNARALERIAKQLARWNADGRQRATLRVVVERLAPICARLAPGTPERQRCAAAIRA
jgi:hypothetical protein